MKKFYAIAIVLFGVACSDAGDTASNTFKKQTGHAGRCIKLEADRNDIVHAIAAVCSDGKTVTICNSDDECITVGAPAELAPLAPSVE